MNDGRRIPYSRMRDIRKWNQSIEKTPEEWEKEVYRKVKKIRVPYERLDRILEDSAEQVYALSRKKRRKKYARILLLFGSFFIFVLRIAAITGETRNVH